MKNQEINIMEGPAGDTWIDDDGIVNYKSKKRPVYDATVAKQQMDIISGLIGKKKVCFLADLSDTSAFTKEVREYYAKVADEHYKAVAIVASSPESKLAATAVATANEQPFPILLTEDMEEAREFLKKYL